MSINNEINERQRSNDVSMTEKSENNNNNINSNNKHSKPKPKSGKKRFSFKKVLADTLQGRIYLALDKNHKGDNDQWCVVKETWKELVKSGKSRDGHNVPEDFDKEKRLQNYLSNLPNCDTGFVRSIEEWDDSNCYYLAMEYCRGGELFDYIRKMHTEGPMARLVSQVSRKSSMC
jgi:serine/threonine protein kinase